MYRFDGGQELLTHASVPQEGLGEYLPPQMEGLGALKPVLAQRAKSKLLALPSSMLNANVLCI